MKPVRILCRIENTGIATAIRGLETCNEVDVDDLWQQSRLGLFDPECD
jgi:hypothetical protein